MFSQADTTIYKFCEQMPEFNGGEKQLLKFVFSNLHSPNNGSFVTKILFSFVIEKDGTISNKKILINGNNVHTKTGNESIDECLKGWIDNALLVLHKMPKWNPGMHNGKYVRVKYTLPLHIDPVPNLWDDK